MFACGPQGTLRVGFQPYGVLPLLPAHRYKPGDDPTTALVHKVATAMREIVTPAIASVPRRRAGEDQDVDAVM